MSGKPALTDIAYQNAIAHLAKIHATAYKKAEVEGSSITSWNLEFLRNGEFSTFTNMKKAAQVVTNTNELIGKNFMKVLVDAAHCGDSDMTITENEECISEVASRNEIGIFHASAKTTRGCLSSDDGWIPALLTACAKTGQLNICLLYTSPSPRDATLSRMPSSA